LSPAKFSLSVASAELEASFLSPMLISPLIASALRGFLLLSLHLHDSAVRVEADDTMLTAAGTLHFPFAFKVAEHAVTLRTSNLGHYSVPPPQPSSGSECAALLGFYL
jgi:hypothetical protein